MDSDYGVATHNKFAFLDDEPPAPKKKSEPKAKVEEKPVVKKTDNARPASARQGRGEGRGEGRGRGRGGRGRGNRGEGAAEGGKREYDRHESGTGRDKHAKKGGAGKFNWGQEGQEGQADSDRPPRRRYDRDGDRPRRNHNKDTEGETPAAPADGEKAAPVEGEEAAAADGEVKVNEEPKVEEPPEPETMGYEEFLAAKAATMVVDDKKTLRVVSNDDTKFACKAIPAATNDVEVEYGLGGNDAASNKKENTKKDKGKKNKISMDEFAAASPAASKGGRGGRGEGRGGRGEGRGGRGRGGNRGGDFKLRDDEFPTLGGKK